MGNDRCWCGRELVEESRLARCSARPDALEFTRVTEWRCPDHGENYIWRPCRFGDPTSPPDGRYCRQRGRYVTREDCASCPIPALVEAVEDGRRLVSMLASFLRAGERMDAEAEQWVAQFSAAAKKAIEEASE